MKTRLQELREKYPDDPPRDLDPYPWQWVCENCMPRGEHSYRESFDSLSIVAFDQGAYDGFSWNPQPQYEQSREAYGVA